MSKQWLVRSVARVVYVVDVDNAVLKRDVILMPLRAFFAVASRLAVSGSHLPRHSIHLVSPHKA